MSPLNGCSIRIAETYTASLLAAEQEGDIMRCMEVRLWHLAGASRKMGTDTIISGN